MLSIGQSAFNGCTGLTEINIPDTVTSIGMSAFQGCSGLTELTIPNSVTSIGKSAFYQCNNLSKLTIPFTGSDLNGENQTYLSYMFGANDIYSNYVPSSLKEVTVTNVTEIGNYAFYGCSNITTINLPENVTSIGIQAFYNCKNLTDLVLPNTVTKIGDHAFYNCSNLTDLVLPNTITAIGNYSFSNCLNLKSVYYQGTQEDFSIIEISSKAELDLSLVYYYSKEEPATAGNYWHYDSDGNIVVWEIENTE